VDRQTSFDTINGVGRALSALADLGTIVFAWFLARRIFGVRTAHLTALLLALTVLHIQLAHFFAVDTYVACFAADRCSLANAPGSARVWRTRCWPASWLVWQVPARSVR